MFHHFLTNPQSLRFSFVPRNIMQSTVTQVPLFITRCKSMNKLKCKLLLHGTTLAQLVLLLLLVVLPVVTSSFVPCARSATAPTTTTTTRTRSRHGWNHKSLFTDIQEPILSNVIQSSKNENKRNLNPSKIPFIIEQIGKSGQPSKSDADEISNIVISVFFQEEAERRPENRSMGSITKPLILAYLKNLQYGDVRGKKYMLGSGVNNSMFVARRVVPSNQRRSNDDSDGEGDKGVWRMSGNTLQDLEERSSIGKIKGKIYNIESLIDSAGTGAGAGEYELGDILGFVDVTEKIFGLPSDTKRLERSSSSDTMEESNTLSQRKNMDSSSGEESFIRSKKKQSLRPVLTNLSVKPEARCSGVGSALVNACEDVVMEASEWSRNYYEMVLEVEEENIAAQKFYEKKGYVALFADPSSRRYDTSGLLLNNVRTTKICYRKDLTLKKATGTGRANTDDNNKDRWGMGIGLWFDKVKQAIGIQ